MLYQHPVDVTVRLNDWARFNCTVNCTCADNVGWYKAGYQAVLKSTTDLTIPGITVMEPTPVPRACTSGRKTYFFSVLATEALNNSAIYCAAYTDPDVSGCQSVCISEMCYSRPALLTVGKLRSCVCCSCTMLIVFAICNCSLPQIQFNCYIQ